MRLYGSELPRASPTVARLQGLPDGMPGAIDTLRAMRGLARDAIRDPSQGVRELALSVIGDAGWVGQARALQQWVQTNIRYVRDPIDASGGVELVQSPQKTIEYRAGDCDDQATLLASLLSAIGHPARFVALGFKGQPLSHVMVQTKVSSTGNDSRDWAGVETIVPQGFGWMPSGVTSHYILKV